MPARPIGDRAMTVSQRVQRHRQNQAARIRQLEAALTAIADKADRALGRGGKEDASAVIEDIAIAARGSRLPLTRDNHRLPGHMRATP